MIRLQSTWYAFKIYKQYHAALRVGYTPSKDAATVFGRQDHKTKTKEVAGPVVRQQLRACKANHDEMKKYHYQMDLLLKSMFPNGKQNHKADPANWMCKMTNLVGGLEYQHPHADQGWGLDYELTVKKRFHS
jgi:hypothetical protein